MNQSDEMLMELIFEHKTKKKEAILFLVAASKTKKTKENSVVKFD
jgi:hypothetical protein